LVRKSVATIPKLPNVEIIAKPIEEQPIQELEAIPRIEPESTDLSNLSLEFLIKNTFMETTIPIKAEIMFVRTNPTTASLGT
jgi:hypothetical protein